MLLLTVLAACIVHRTSHAAAFDPRSHLGTRTPYDFRRPIPDAPSIHDTPDPDGYSPVFLYLVARHGTRWPTYDRMQQINSLQALFKDCNAEKHHPWIGNWISPFSSMSFAAGDLHPVGEAEMTSLGARLRNRFPSIADGGYFPKRYPIVSTQVPRAAQSASAFALGFFPGRPAGGMEAQVDVAGAAASANGQWCSANRQPQPVALFMSPKHSDPLLRFFDCCPKYEQHEDFVDQWLAAWMHSNWSTMVPALSSRLGLRRDMDPCDIDAMWQLCQVEAALYGQLSGGACDVFSSGEVLSLEWMDDVALWETHGRGADINYRIAAPLLADAADALQAAAGGGAFHEERARLYFAHCETLTPLAVLMGLFEEAREAAAMPRVEVPERYPMSAADAEREVRSVDAAEDLPLKILQRQHAQGAAAAAAAADVDADASGGAAVDVVRDGGGSGGSERGIGGGSERGIGGVGRGQEMVSGSSNGTSSSGGGASICGSGRSSDGSGGSGNGSSSEGSGSVASGGSGAADSSGSSSSIGSGGGVSDDGAGGSGVGGGGRCGFKRKGRPVAGRAAPSGWLPLPRSAEERRWRGSTVSPLGANLALVLYRRQPGKGVSGPEHHHLVRVLYNEQVVTLPGCGSADCPLEDFLRVVVADKATPGTFEWLCVPHDVAAEE